MEFSKLTQDPRSKLLLAVLGQIYLVGGAVRDSLIGQPIKDLDYACALESAEAEKRLLNSGMRVYRTGARHDTLTVFAVDSLPSVEITSFRAESIEADLGLRDFTVNALAIDCEKGRLLDPVNGQCDIENKLLRVASKQSFADDPLRILRLARFANQLGFKIDAATKESALLLVNRLAEIALERIREEFSLILCSRTPASGIRLLKELQVLEIILPEINRFVGFEQNSFHTADLFDHTLEATDKTDADLVTRLAILFHDVGKPDTLSVDDAGERHFYRHEAEGAEITRVALERLKFPNQVVEDVCQLVRLHMRPTSAGDSGLRRLLRDCQDLYPKWREIKEADASSCKWDLAVLSSELQEFDRRVEEILRAEAERPFRKLKIGGKELIQLGLEPGPRFGEILGALEDKVLENPDLNEKETLLKLVKELVT